MEDKIMIPMTNFSNRYPSIFDRIMNPNYAEWVGKNFEANNFTMPSVNVKERSDAFGIEIAAPGFDKSDFKIEIDNNVLTIESEKKETKNNEYYTCREFNYQNFTRSFTLPETVDSEKVVAKYENGILRIDIPKKQEAMPKPLRKVEIG